MSDPRMILSIDTCGHTGSVALARLDGGEVTLLAHSELPGKMYSARLVPAIRDLLAAQSMPPAAIAIIVVTKGPGSFTGIRIGLATAKGLAEVNQTPILAVSRLAALAHKAGAQNPAMQNPIPAAALDASRGEFYFGDFSPERCETTTARSQNREELLTRAAFLDRAASLGPQLAVCEPSVHAVASAATLVDPPTAFEALLSVLPRLSARDYDDPLTLDGNYLRRSDAEIFSQPGAPPRLHAVPRS